MLRLLLALLLLANVAFFAWTRGWLAPTMLPPRHAEHEPERLLAQVRPEAVTVLSAKAASAAVTAAATDAANAARAAAAVCLEAGPLAQAQLAAAEAALAPAQVPQGGWAREAVPTPPLWLVFAGRLPEAAARRAREAELRQLGLDFEVLQAPAELAWGLVLSRHAAKPEAEAALAALAASSPALKGTRVLAMPAPAARYWLRVAQAEPDLQARLQALPPAALTALAGGFKPCVPARPNCK